MSFPQRSNQLASLSTVLSIWISILSLALFSSSLCSAQTQSNGTTTLAIFPDRHSAPISSEFFFALQAALRSDLAANNPELQPLRSHSSDLQILLADQISPGIAVTDSVVIYLHGDCNLGKRPVPYLNPQSSKTLGWVEQRQGKIEPFIHVDCSHIAQFLQPEVRGKNNNQQNQIGAQAIARVVLHEWLHIATQNPRHAKEGIAKAQFTRSDLLSSPAQKGATVATVSSNPTPSSSEPSAGK